MERELINHLRECADLLFRTITRYRPLLANFESERDWLFGQLTHDANTTLLLVRRIMRAAEIRLDEVTGALSNPEVVGEAELVRRARNPLILPMDRLNSLISEKVEPPIPLTALDEKLSTLLRKLDLETKQSKKTVIPSW